MGLKERLQKQMETSDTHKNEKLRTHYYAATVEMLFTGLEATVTKQQGTVKRIDQGRGELAFTSARLRRSCDGHHGRIRSHGGGSVPAPGRPARSGLRKVD